MADTSKVVAKQAALDAEFQSGYDAGLRTCAAELAANKRLFDRMQEADAPEPAATREPTPEGYVVLDSDADFPKAPRIFDTIDSAYAYGEAVNGTVYEMHPDRRNASAAPLRAGSAPPHLQEVMDVMANEVRAVVELLGAGAESVPEGIKQVWAKLSVQDLRLAPPKEWFDELDAAIRADERSRNV